MTLPTGTVTFLFTDIEGSTKRWETNAPAMRTVLARHDEAMRQAISKHRGHVFKTIGDAFCAVFERAEDAIEACLDAQRAIKQIDVPEIGPVRVRMALHTGESDERDGDYFGPAVNRVARLLAIGHGEQVLISATTHAVAQQWLPPQLGMRDMGVHRLKDLSDSEHIFQLTHADLRADFPPLRSIDARPNNLPRQLSSFVGRERELQQLAEMMSDASLLTLTGAGGCGKTRLALRVGQALLSEFPDGVWLVELAALSDPKLVPAAALAALGVREQAGKPLVQTIREHLAHKKVLFILDNCEHLLGACAEFVREILTREVDDKVIATSREALGVPGEVAYRVPSLSLPINGTNRSDELIKYEAISLFVERARSAKSSFTLSDATAPSVLKICRRLDGIPLAIELAAARVKVLSVEQIHAKLDDRFRLLTGGSKTSLERHQTLRAAIAWSYGMLTDDEKHLFRGLSVFAGGWTLESASKICCLPDPDAPDACRILDEFEVLDLLTKLVDKSLVVVEESPAGGDARYSMLETVRQFARDEADTAHETGPARDRHLTYFLALGEEAEPKLIGPEQGQWLARLESEKENLLAALHWSTTLEDAAETGMRLASAIWRFWEIRGHLTIGYNALKKLLARAQPDIPSDPAPRPSLGKTLNAAGAIALTMGNHDEARSLLESALNLRQIIGEKKGIGDSLNSLGLLEWRQGDYTAARQRWEQSLAMRRQISDSVGIAASLNNLGLAAMVQGDYPAARARYEEALSIFRKLGNRAWTAAALNNLGEVLLNMNDLTAARKLYDEALRINQEMGNRAWIVTNLSGLGDASYHAGDFEQARSLYEQALSLSREIGDKLNEAEELTHLAKVARKQKDPRNAIPLHEKSLMIFCEMHSRSGAAKCLEQIAVLASESGAWAESARLFGAADALRIAIDSPRAACDRPECDAALEKTRASLGDDGLEREKKIGQTLVGTGETWQSASDEALNWLRTGTSSI